MKSPIRVAQATSRHNADAIQATSLGRNDQATTVAHDGSEHSWSLPASVVTDLAGIVINGLALKGASIYLAPGPGIDPSRAVINARVFTYFVTRHDLVG